MVQGLARQAVYRRLLWAPMAGKTMLACLHVVEVGEARRQVVVAPSRDVLLNRSVSVARKELIDDVHSLLDLPEGGESRVVQVGVVYGSL